MSKRVKLCALKVSPDFDYSHYLYLLPAAAQSKVQSYLQTADQVRAFAGEFLKHYLLAHWLQQPIGSLKFALTATGRPQFQNPELAAAWDFNLSHSGEWVILALVAGGRVGVDVELIDPTLEAALLAPQVFSLDEQLRVANSVHNFYCLWSKKEAYLKALGSGFLSEDFKRTNFNCAPDQALLDGYVLSRDNLAGYSFALCVLNR